MTDYASIWLQCWFPLLYLILFKNADAQSKSTPLPGGSPTHDEGIGHTGVAKDIMT